MRIVQTAIGVVLASLVVGCAGQTNLARKDKLPDSVLSQDRPSASIVGRSRAAAEEPKRELATTQLDQRTAATGLRESSGVRQASLTEQDLRGVPSLPDGNAGLKAEGPVNSPELGGPRTLLRGDETVGVTNPTRRTDAPVPSTWPATTRRSPDAVADDSAQQISKLAKEIEDIDPEQVAEFLADTRKGAASGHLPQTLAAWRASLSHQTKSGQSPFVRVSKPLPTPVKLEQFSTSRRAEEESARDSQDPSKQLPVAANSKQADAEGGKPRTVKLRYTVSKEDDEGKASGQTTEVANDVADIKKRLRQLAKEMEEVDVDKTEEQLRWQSYGRLLYVMAGETDEGFKPVPGAETLDKRFWRNLMWAISQYFDREKTPRGEARAAQTIELLDEAVASLRKKADLEITSPILCQDVYSFGNYAEFEKYEFRSGQGVVVYWELKNFASDEGKDGFRARTRATIEVYDARGDRRHRSEHEFKDDVSKSRRHDFFCAVAFHLPQELAPGEYVLKVTANDKLTEKIAEKQTKFAIR